MSLVASRLVRTILPAFVDDARDAQHPAMHRILVSSGPWESRYQNRIRSARNFGGVEIAIENKGEWEQ